MSLVSLRAFRRRLLGTLTSIDTTTRYGVYGNVNDLVARLTGTPSRSFYDFLVANHDELLAAAGARP
jgi:hypothetical protein